MSCKANQVSSDHLLYVTSIIFFGRCACSEAHQVQSSLNYVTLLAVMWWWGGFVVMTHDAEISPLHLLVPYISLSQQFPVLTMEGSSLCYY